MKMLHAVAFACFFAVLDARASATCVESSATLGLEFLKDSGPTERDVYAGGQLHVSASVHKGAGEHVDTQATLEALVLAKAELLKAGWLIPTLGSAMTPTDTGSPELRSVTLTLVSAPSVAGDHDAAVPPLPIVLRQASGAKVTLCTSESQVAVHDPTDDTSMTPRGDAPPVPEFETWMAARWALAALCILLPLLAWLAWWWFHRPKYERRSLGSRATPFERANSVLSNLQFASDMPADEMADAATDAFRSYLADAHHLRALECTTEELVARLGSTEATRRHLGITRAWLMDADIIKFADKQLSHTEREAFLSSAVGLLRAWGNAP